MPQTNKFLFYLILFNFLSPSLLLKTNKISKDTKYNYDKECNLVNQHCILKNSIVKCGARVIYPYTCQNKNSGVNCDYSFEWRIDHDLVRFSFRKYNYRFDEWIGLIISNDNSRKDESDLVLAAVSSHNESRVLDGKINAAKISLNEISGILDPTVQYNKNYIDVQFTRRISSENSVRLDECPNAIEDGFFVFFVSGKINSQMVLDYLDASDLNIEISSKSVGPFCLKSCAPSNDASNKAKRVSSKAFLHRAEKSNRLNTNDLVLNKAQVRAQADDSTPITEMPTTTSTTSTTTSTATTTTTPVTTTIITSSTTTTIPTTTTTATSTETTTFTTPTTTSTTSTTSTSTSTITTTTTATTTTTTTTTTIKPTTTTVVPTTITSTSTSTSTTTPTTTTITTTTTISTTTITTTTNPSTTTSTTTTPTTTSTRSTTQTTLAKYPVDFYLKFKIIGATWTDDLSSIDSANAKVLANNITSIISSIVNPLYQLKSFSVLSFKREQLKRYQRDTSSNIIVNSKGTVLSPVSGETTRSQINQVLSMSFKSNSLNYGEPIVNDMPDNIETSTVPETITDKMSSNNDNGAYSRSLAIALSCSLIATIIVLGGALLAYYYWRRKQLTPRYANNYTNQSSSRGLRLGGGGNAIPASGYKYANQRVKLDGIPENNFSDDFEMQFSNPAFSDYNDMQYTDFTGSREVGIDVGPFNEEVSLSPNANEAKSNALKANQNSKNDLNKQPKVEHIKEIIKESGNKQSPAKSVQNNDKSNLILDADNVFFDDLFGKVAPVKKNAQESLTNSTIKPTVENETDDTLLKNLSDVLNKNYLEKEKKIPSSVEDEEEQEEEEEEEERSNEDPDNELNIIFSKEVEENLSDLFGPYKSDASKLNAANAISDNQKSFQLNFNDNNRKSSPKKEIINRKFSNSSLKEQPRFNAPLGFSSSDKLDHESDLSSIEMENELNNRIASADSKNLNSSTKINSDDDDLSMDSDDNEYKTIAKSAVKNLRIESGNKNFVIDPQKENIKQMYKNRVPAEPEFSRRNINDDDSDSLNDEPKIVQYTHASVLNNNFDDLFSNNFGDFPKPRLCILKKNNYDGLGIHLCDNKNHMIQDIEPNSPAELGGVKPGDKILFVNGENVQDSSYGEVISKLKNALALNKDISLTVMNAIEYNILKTSMPSHSSNNRGENNNSIDGYVSHESNNTSSLEEDKKESFEFNDNANSNSKNISNFDYLFQPAPAQTTATPQANPSSNADLLNDDNFVNSLYDYNSPKDQVEFNPFEDVPNEIFKPFLYTSIPPPPDNFKANEDFQQNDNKFDDYDQFESKANNSSKLAEMFDSDDEYINNSFVNNQNQNHQFSNSNELSQDTSNLKNLHDKFSNVFLNDLNKKNSFLYDINENGTDDEGDDNKVNKANSSDSDISDMSKDELDDNEFNNSNNKNKRF